MPFIGYIDGKFWLAMVPISSRGFVPGVDRRRDPNVTEAPACRVNGSARLSFDDSRASGLNVKQRAKTMRRFAEALRQRGSRLTELAVAKRG